ncbi:DUF2071 domain-containing protein [Mucilaginibacter ginsenosidivorax]|uniref:DUF2071 domain-containing protein n=1 Tax=Mucilaginibacter ginsenosidivorax TaxID=862126 RepID=A0A5B8W5N0_9SPHI|nr:DUF2071 domain-containing protein [Mucilaginibacter ginsenosidivorax]QEC78212.1 hypothetical protein FSB76_20550 [Mucilaginibacter ginsenosidivorax]
MPAFLKDHPFAVEAFFEHSVVLTFAFPKEQLAHLIPECLTLDAYQDKWAFIAIALVNTTGLRPKGFPKFMGNDFTLIGYRVFVRYTNNAGKRLRGLYILKSETDKKMMEYLGNLFTHYAYTTTDIVQQQHDDQLYIQSAKSGLDLHINLKGGEIALPAGSPFTDWKEARKFAGPLPFTFTYNKQAKKVLIIEGVREDWIPKPVEVISRHISFFDDMELAGGVLANAFIINNIPYHWKKGRTEQWNH